MEVLSAIGCNFLKLNLIIKRNQKFLVTVNSSDEFISTKNQGNIYVLKEYMVWFLWLYNNKWMTVKCDKILPEYITRLW